MYYWKKILLVVSTLLSLNSLLATHIVGGVIYYEYLGGTKYKLIFEIYKDCSPSVKIGFDGSCDPRVDLSCKLPLFYYSIFENGSSTNRDYDFNTKDKNGLLLKSSEIIRPIIVNPCLAPNNTCVSKGIYEKIVDLDPSKGYTIQYQRCCRNDGIGNIQNQPGTGDKPGITLRTYIPPINSYRNNSARFKSFPPIFICVGQQFYFDHSASDPDGDQLRYALTSPLQGLSTDRPYDDLQSLNAPPVNWSPPYSLNNVMGGTPVMAIDSISGLLTCKPNAAGRFVVSVQVKEIRGGIAIDSFSRDFQYNVLDCDIPFADAPFKAGTYDPNADTGIHVTCGNLTQTFNNKSTNADRVEWNFGDPSSGANNVSTNTNPTHTFGSPGRYIVTLYAYKTRPNGQLCTDSTRRICYINPKPTIKLSYSPPSACEGGILAYTDLSEVSSGTITAWNWDFGNGQSSSLPNPSISYPKAGIFTTKLTVTTSNSCPGDSSFTITIFPKPTIASSSLNACIGQPLNLNCNVSVAAPSIVTQYRWTLPNGSIVNLCNTTYTPPSIGSGTINLWARTDKGCVDSQNYNYVVNPLPTIIASNDTTLCYDQSVTLNAVGGLSYVWSPPTYLSNPNIQSPIASPPYPSSFRYTVQGTDKNGCSNQDSLTIFFYKKSFIDAGPDTSICLNKSSPLFKDDVQLEGKGVFSSVRWSPTGSLSNPNILNPIAKPISNTDYILYGTDSNRCIVKDTMRVIVLDPSVNLILQDTMFLCAGTTRVVVPYDQGTISSYSWSPSIGIDSPQTRSPRFTPLDTTLYILTISNYCYTKNDSILINASAPPDPQLKSLDAICLGDTYQFSSNPNLVSYLWTTSEPTFSDRNIYNPTVRPENTQAYILRVVDKYGCTNTDTILLEVFRPPGLNVLGVPKYLCQGDSIQLTAFTDQPCTYLWKENKSISSDTARQVFAFPYDTTQYFITATTKTWHRCSTTRSFIINVQKPIYPYVDRPTKICKGKYITMRASGGLYYHWTPPLYINDTLTDTPQVYPDKFFTYKVYISNDCFIDSILADVYVDTLPKVDAGNDTTIFGDSEITLTAKSEALLFNWLPKPMILSNPFLSSITVSPPDTTLYKVFVTDGQGCIGYDSVFVFIDPSIVLLIPTGFSPNGDGKNDVFKIIKSLNVRELFSFEVFNRWGEKVFFTKNINDGWNGTYNELPSPGGVYVWRVEGIGAHNEKIMRSGNVTLIR